MLNDIDTNDVTFIKWCSMFCRGNPATGEITGPDMPAIPICEECLEKYMKGAVVKPKTQEPDLLDKLKRIASSTDY